MSQGAARDGRVRSHSIGHSGGAHRLFPHSPVEKERPVGHRAADHDLPALPHIHACASQTHISGGRDVGRMDVPHRRLQGWQVRARTGCSLSVRALCVFGSGALPMTICEGQRRGLVAPVALSYPLRCKTPCLMTSCLRPTDNNRPAALHLARVENHIARSSDAPSRKISCLCNQLEFVRYSAGCYVVLLIVA
jgi:hypothetical protein